MVELDLAQAAFVRVSQPLVKEGRACIALGPGRQLKVVDALCRVAEDREPRGGRVREERFHESTPWSNEVLHLVDEDLLDISEVIQLAPIPYQRGRDLDPLVVTLGRPWSFRILGAK